MTPKNHSIIISGPTSGLGRSLFEKLAKQDCFLIGLGRDLTRISHISTIAPWPVNLIEFDFGSDSKFLADAIAKLCSALTSVPENHLVFISNASIIEPIGKATDLELVDIELAIRINCITPLMIVNHLAEIMRTRHQPLLIINVSSGAAYRAIRGWQAYCTSKAAYKMALDVLAAENPNVHVVHYDPGVMNTSMQSRIREKKYNDMPDVSLFHSYQSKGMLKEPTMVADEIITLIQHHLP